MVAITVSRDIVPQPVGVLILSDHEAQIPKKQSGTNNNTQEFRRIADSRRDLETQRSDMSGITVQLPRIADASKAVL